MSTTKEYDKHPGRVLVIHPRGAPASRHIKHPERC